MLYLRDPNLGGWWVGWGGIAEAQQEINIQELQDWFGMGTNFEWQVQTRNEYAWSNFSEIWAFTYESQPTAPIVSIPPEFGVWLDENDNRIVEVQ